MWCGDGCFQKKGKRVENLNNFLKICVNSFLKNIIRIIIIIMHSKHISKH